MPPDAHSARARTAAVILAAGQARRMGAPKALLEYEGEALVRRAARAALAAGYSEVHVVVPDAPAFRSALAGLSVSVVVNPRAAEGIGTSIAAGVRALHPDVQRMALLLADQPCVTAEYLKALRLLAPSPETVVVASRYAGTVGVPRSSIDRFSPI